MLEIKTLASSSKGNCYFVSDGSSSLLLECGQAIKKIEKSTDLRNVNGCLLTHEHGDHSKSVNDILRNCINLYASPGTIGSLEINSNYDHFLRPVEPGAMFAVGTFKIIAFPTEHDAAEPIGFLIKSIITSDKLLFATDTYFIKNRFADLNYIMIECNYCEEILKSNIKLGLISKVQSDRLWKSHFSLQNVKEFLKVQNLSNVKEIYLMHLSNGNSNASKFKKEIQELTGKIVYVCEE